MTAIAHHRRHMVLWGPLALGVLLLALAPGILPSSEEISAAQNRANALFRHAGIAVTSIAQARAAPPAPPRANPAGELARRFDAGERLTSAELQQLIAQSTRHASARALSRMADAVGAGLPNATSRISWDVAAQGRPAVAATFFEMRPDRTLASYWRQRVELHLRANDPRFARALVMAAARRPGVAAPADLLSAAYAVNAPELLVVAAERGALPRLDPSLSLDLVRRAVKRGDMSLVGRIDRAGSGDWRRADPWLAMTLASRAGDVAGALRYASWLPSGADSARRTIIMASGDKQAIRQFLLAEGQRPGRNAAVVAQQLLDAGLRSDSVAQLRLHCAGRPPADPLCQRMLYLMGPRPEAADVAWLRGRASESPAWLTIFLERERPAAALAFVESRPDADTNAMLLKRAELARAARSRDAQLRAISSLFDGRRLSAADIAAAAALAPRGMGPKLTLAIARARIATGAPSPSDRMDLAWAAWNRHDAGEAFEQLDAHLAAHPDDRQAITLMAEVEAKRRGKKAALPWLEKLLRLSAPGSRERAEVLERLGRTHEAIKLVETLRQTAPADVRLSLIHARLLIAAGDPGRARKVLTP